MTQEEKELIETRKEVLEALKDFVSIGKLDNQTMKNILDSIMKPYIKLGSLFEYERDNTVEEKFLIQELNYYLDHLNK
ncbi:MAG: hypothetical protein MJZ94_00790 [Bacteroidales bacterium]|nr:hypothetical protein [Bacteroidales bacterium]